MRKFNEMRKMNILLSALLVSMNIFTAPAADNTLTLSDLLEAQTLWQVANRDIVEADINHFLSWLSYLKTTGNLTALFGNNL